jgi:hypothetical protein
MLPYCWAGLLLVGAFVSAGFTPGPWSVGVVRFAGRTQLVCAYGKGFVCEVESPVRDGEFSHEEREANARLIAAAPELYATRLTLASSLWILTATTRNDAAETVTAA